MSNAIGPIHIKERPSAEMQSRIDAEVRLSESHDYHCRVHQEIGSLILISIIGCAGGEASKRGIRSREGSTEEG